MSVRVKFTAGKGWPGEIVTFVAFSTATAAACKPEPFTEKVEFAGKISILSAPSLIKVKYRYAFETMRFAKMPQKFTTPDAFDNDTKL